MDDLLRQLNLTKYEIQAYLTLLKVDSVTAYQLGNLSKIPSGRIYDVVESLVSKGLISILPGTPRLVKAIDPKVGLKVLLDKKNRQWQKQATQLNHLINSLEKQEETETVSVSKGRYLAYQNAIELYESAKKELLFIAGSLTPAKRGVDVVTPTKRMVKRGVDVRFIAPIDNKNIDMARKIARTGVKIRNYPVKNFKLHVVDGKYAMITVVDKTNPEDRTIIKINQKESAQTLRALFLSLWDKSKPLA